MLVICIFNFSENLWNILYNSILKYNGMIVEKQFFKKLRLNKLIFFDLKFLKSDIKDYLNVRVSYMLKF